jgi:cytochrome c peroxidase
MRARQFYSWHCLISLLALIGTFFATAARPADTDGVQAFADPSGVIATVDINGRVTGQGPFFQSLGINGRSCATCHVASQAMSISAAGVQARFVETGGADPLFATVDGANCPSAQRGNPADHSLLLTHGLIRVFIPMPTGPTAQFSISVVHDPYGCAMLPNPAGGAPFVSVYRRPLPTANLGFLSTIMFDGRETHQPLNALSTFPANLSADLMQQAADAVTTHAQAPTAPAADVLTGIVNFELGLFSAQAVDSNAGWLHALGANGGPTFLSGLQPKYYPGINDALGADPNGLAFNPVSMTLYDAWSNISDNNGNFLEGVRDAARRAIARGELVFDTAPVNISNVRGLNDNAALGKPSTFVGHCATCHDTPNVGNHSLALPLDIGTSHTGKPEMESDPNILAALSQLSEADLPVYLISGCPNPFNAGEPESFYTTDPAKALITGQCSDFNRGKGPVLRGLAARAPYFHNGSAANLHELVNFYNERFQMNLSEEQKSDLIAFLNSL